MALLWQKMALVQWEQEVSSVTRKLLTAKKLVKGFRDTKKKLSKKKCRDNLKWLFFQWTEVITLANAESHLSFLNN